MSLPQDFRNALADALMRAGTDGALVRADDPGAPGTPIRFLLNHPSRRDEAIVNAYGVNALVLTIEATAELIAHPPKKFDQVIPKGPALEARMYSLDAVLTRQAANTVVAFTAYVKGAGV